MHFDDLLAVSLKQAVWGQEWSEGLKGVPGGPGIHGEGTHLANQAGQYQSHRADPTTADWLGAPHRRWLPGYPHSSKSPLRDAAHPARHTHSGLLLAMIYCLP